MNVNFGRTLLICIGTVALISDCPAQKALPDLISIASANGFTNGGLDQFFGPARASATLVIDVENLVNYQGDIGDPSKFARNPGITPSAGFANFSVTTDYADIVAVNGQAAKGLWVARNRVIAASPNPTPGQAIADITATGIREQIFDILQPDGSRVGTIMAVGFPGSEPPPGFPASGLDTKTLAAERANFAITGGTGAFLGARGQEEGTGGAFGSGPFGVGRGASIAEDPANRRINGGGTTRFVLQVIPMTVPQVVGTERGPAVFHADSTLVTSSRPATPGETLTLFATGARSGTRRW